jgi:hypothetical protein
MTMQSTLHPRPRPMAPLANTTRSEFSERFLFSALYAFRLHYRSHQNGTLSSKSCGRAPPPAGFFDCAVSAF